MKSLPEYKKVKDKVCLVYLGTSKQVLNQLISNISNIKQILPALEVDLYGKDEFASPEIKPYSALNPHKYGLVKQIAKNFDLNKELGI